MIPTVSIPLVELFMAGLFAVIATESVKWLFNIKESSIGFHSSNTGELMKTWKATIMLTIVILSSNVIAFVTYHQIQMQIESMLSLGGFIVDLMIILVGIVLIWVYLKKNHYNRAAS